MTRFTNPSQLPCLHSFCFHCLQRIRQTSGVRDTIPCPKCRRKFRISGNGDLNSFPTNFGINMTAFLCITEQTFNDHHALALKDCRDEDFENILKQSKLCGGGAGAVVRSLPSDPKVPGSIPGSAESGIFGDLLSR